MLPDAAARHAVRVLRLRPGDGVILFDGHGREYEAELTTTSRTGAGARILCAGEEEPVATLSLHLALGISRGQRMDFALQKATELGIGGCSPLLTARTMVRLSPDKLGQRLAHWRQVVISACEQSGRRRIPQLDPPQSFSAWLETWSGQGVLLDPEASASLPELAPPGGRLTLLVGPEGGLTREERAAAQTKGLVPVRLGPYILRTETAPLAAIAAVQALWGSFRA